MADKEKQTTYSAQVCASVPTKIITDVGEAWWQEWPEAPQRLDWTIVKKTDAFTKGAVTLLDPATKKPVTKTLSSADKDAMLADLQRSFPSGARPTNFDVEKAFGTVEQRLLFTAIDEELRTSGLEFQVAWNAIDPCADGWIDKVLKFRADNLKPLEGAYELTSLGDDLAVHAVAEKHAAIGRRDELAASLTDARKAHDTNKDPSREATLVANVAGFESMFAAANIRVEIATENLSKIQASGKHGKWSFGGHKRYGKLGEDVDVIKKEFLGFDYIKSAGHFGELIVNTYLRYFNREGAPNAINTCDGTFTYGTGFSCTGGLGTDLLNCLQSPPKSPVGVVTRDALRALEVAIWYLQCCGISLGGMIGTTNDLRILHTMTGDNGRVAYMLQTRFYPPLSRKADRSDWTAAERQEEDQIGQRDERFLAFRYLRHRPDLIRAFIAIADKAPLESKFLDLGGRLTKNYEISTGLHQLGLFVMFNKTQPSSHLHHLTKRSAVFTLIHHVRLWWAGAGCDDPIQWAIARGYVGATHLRKGELDWRGNLLEHKGDAPPPGLSMPTGDARSLDDQKATAGAEEKARRAAGKKDALASKGAIDDPDDDDAKTIVGVKVDASDLGQFQLARGAWIYALVANMRYVRSQIIKRAVERGDDQIAIDPEDLLGDMDSWATRCLMWWEFCRDFAAELSGMSLGDALKDKTNDVSWVTGVFDSKFGPDAVSIFPLDSVDVAVDRRAREILVSAPDDYMPDDARLPDTLPRDILWHSFLGSDNADRILKEARDDVDAKYKIIRLTRARVLKGDSRIYMYKKRMDEHAFDWLTRVQPGEYVLCTRDDFAEANVTGDMTKAWATYVPV